MNSNFIVHFIFLFYWYEMFCTCMKYCMVMIFTYMSVFSHTHTHTKKKKTTWSDHSVISHSSISSDINYFYMLKSFVPSLLS